MFRSKYFYKTLRKLAFLAAAVLTLYGVIASYNQSVLPDFTFFDFVPTRAYLDRTVTDVSIIKCWRSSCNVPEGYTQVLPALDHASPGNLFRYYLVVKYLPPEEVTKVLVDLEFGPALDSDPASDPAASLTTPETETFVVDSYKLVKKFVLTTPAEGPLPLETPAIRHIDVLFGSSDLIDSRPYFHSLHYAISEYVHPVISVFKISSAEAVNYQQQLDQFDQLKSDFTFETTSSKFKVLQLSDLHFGQNPGTIHPDGTVSSDLRTINFVAHSLDVEQPDLVVITGDLVDFDRSIDYKSVLLKALQPILSRGVRFVFTFGDELRHPVPRGSSGSDYTAYRINSFLSTLPNCYNSVIEQEQIHGKANYDIRVIRNDQVVGHVTLLDSEGQKVHSSQINYLYRIRSSQLVTSNVFKLLFFHYPLPQFRPVGKFKIVGEYNEKHPLNSKTDTKFVDDIISCGYQAVGVGHEHENDACILHEPNPGSEIWLCYNSAGGDSAHTKLNSQYNRKVRFYEMDFEKNVMLSWKRGEVEKTGYDYQVIHQF